MKSFIALLALALGHCCVAAAKPNILFILADDWGRNAGCYRDAARPGINDVLHTPNIDRVAREGVLFRNAFVSAPSCTPSRAAIATGCHFWRTGQHAFQQVDPNWGARPDPGVALPGFGALLEKHGYLVGRAFKTLDAPWYPGRPFEAGLDVLRLGKFAERFPDVAVARRELEEAIRRGIRQMLSARTDGQPFCHVFGAVNPHRPFKPGSGRALWGINPDALRGKLPPYWPDVPETREDVADTLGEVLGLDSCIGAILAELEAAGELDNTLVVLTSDNGINMPHGKAHLYDLGCHAPLLVRWGAGIPKPGRVVDDFVNLIDLAPTFLEAAGIATPATMDGRSLLPLLRSPQSGQIDPARDAVVTGRERHQYDARPDNLPYPMRALRTKDHLYIRNFKPDRWPCGDPYAAAGPGDPGPQGGGTVAWLTAHRDAAAVRPLFELHYGKRHGEELYDLRRDPDQMRNVAADPLHAETKRALAERLLKVLRDTGDRRLDDAFDRPPYVVKVPAR